MSNQRHRTITRFERSKAQANKHGAARTAEIYAWAAKRLDTWLTVVGDDREFSQLRHDDLDDFLDAFARGKDGFSEHADSYTNQIYRSLVSFYAWVVDEYELPVNPMKRVIPRQVGELHTEGKVLSDQQLGAVLDVVAHDRKDFYAIRDHAILRLLLTGPRNSEVVGLRVSDIDLTKRTYHVHGKGDARGVRSRTIGFGNKTTIALDRYLEHRERHPDAERPELWLGKRGPLRDRGLHRMVEKRAEQAGIPDVYPHMFRHTAAHRWLADGGSESDLMRNMGWKSTDMVRHYAQEKAAERARDAYRKRGLDDRI